eukprot:11258040-Prorocentrum_lima.AAC.1
MSWFADFNTDELRRRKGRHALMNVVMIKAEINCTWCRWNEPGNDRRATTHHHEHVFAQVVVEAQVQ